MSDAKYTKGPWVIEGNDLFGKEDGYTVHIAEIHMNDEDNQFRRENSNLIAAAPELYEALLGCLWMIEEKEGTGDENDKQVDAVRLALAKARGEV